MSYFKNFLRSYFLSHGHGKSCGNHDFSKMSKIYTTLMGSSLFQPEEL